MEAIDYEEPGAGGQGAMRGGVVEEVARCVVRAVDRGDLYILTHPEQREFLRRRAAKLDAMFEPSRVVQGLGTITDRVPVDVGLHVLVKRSGRTNGDFAERRTRRCAGDLCGFCAGSPVSDHLRPSSRRRSSR
jgi:hypothetical protein